MYKLTFPEGRDFTGVYLTVAFRDGVGETDSVYLAERFRQKGLTVEAKASEPPSASKRRSKEAPETKE